MGIYIKQQGNTVVFAHTVAVVKVASHGDYYWMIGLMLIPSFVFAQIALNSCIAGLWLGYS